MPADREQGFILIAVLWVALLLSIFGLNAATKSRLQGVQAINIQDWHLQAQALHSGLDMGLHQYLKYQENQGLLERKEEWESVAGRDLELWHPRYEPYSANIGDQEVEIQILSLQAKLDINAVDVNLLQDIVERCTVDSGAQATEITNSILDWRDQDDMRRESGAEEDYYLSLHDPYLPKNGDIQSLGELLLVKGVQEDIFYGTSEHPGLKDFFCVHGAQERMEIQSAAPETFYALLDLNQEIIQEILAEREQGPLDGLSELGEILPAGHMDQLQKYYKAEQGQEGVRIRACMPAEGQAQGRCKEMIWSSEE